MDVAIIPRILLDKLELVPERRAHLNVLLSSLLLFAMAAVLVRYGGALTILPRVCLAQALFGIPCPGCGVTRGALAFIAGDVGRAWALNPGAPFLCAAVAFQIPLRSCVMCGMCGACGERFVVNVSRMMTLVVVVVLIISWVNNIY